MKQSLAREGKPWRQTRPKYLRPPRSATSLLLAAIFTMLFLFSSAQANAGEFSVKSFTPKGLVTGPAVIRIEFTSPMVKSADVGAALDEAALPISISPTLTGQGKWLNELTFIYQPPSGYLAEATEYTVRLKDSLRDAYGNSLQGAASFKLHTPPLAFLGMKQVNFDPNGGFVDYQMLFNIPVNPARLDGFLDIRDKGGKKVPRTYTSAQVARTIELRMAAADGTPVSVKIERGLTSERGPLGLAEPVSIDLARDLSLKINSSRAESEYGGTYIYMETTAQIDVEKAASYIELTPPKKFTVESWGSSLRIRGDFKPRERVTVLLRKGLPPIKGPALETDWERAFVFPDTSPSIYFNSQGRFVSPANEAVLLPISSVNVERVDVAVQRVYDNNVPFVMRGGWPYDVSDLAEEIFTHTYQVDGRPNETATYALDLKKIIGSRRGLFSVRVNQSNSWPSASRIINITDIAASMKLFEKGALLWANSLVRGEPIKGARVTVYSSSNQVLATGRTNGDGVWLYKHQGGWNPSLRPDVAVLEHEGDISVLHLDNSIWQAGEPEYAGEPYAAGAYLAMCFAPRGVFRPGESVPLQIILRERDLSLKEPFPVQLKVTTSRGREWTTATVTLSDMGMASYVVQLSDAAPTGTWRAEVFIPGEKTPVASSYFMVEDFAPPKIRVDASSDKRELRPDEKVTLHLFAQYLFGAPGDNLSYEVEATLIPREYQNEKWPGYRFTDDRITFTTRTGNTLTGTLSASGEATLSDTTEKWRPPSILDVSYRTGVMEDGGRWVYKTQTLPYYPSERLLGIKSPTDAIASGTPVDFAFAAIDTAGGPQNPTTATLSVLKEHARLIETEVDGRRNAEIRHEFTPIEGYDSLPITFADGTSSAKVMFPTGGSYLVAIEDPESGATSAQRLYVRDVRWNVGDSTATLPESLRITLDKDIYRKGEKAKAHITGSFSGTLLLTVETDEVLYHDVVSAPQDGVELTFEVTEKMAPNAWVTAHLIRPAIAEDTWSSRRAYGAVPLTLDCSALEAVIELKAPDALLPLAKNEFSLQLKDKAGRGTQGEVLLMLVDDGVLGLTRYQTPDFYRQYIKRRGLSIAAYDIYAELLPLYRKTPPLLTAGGGADDEMGAMAKVSMSPVRADRFKVLTLWERVQTDKNGRADFSFVLPEFTGRARLMAVAAARGTFGSAESGFTVARDVVAELTLPRVAAPGDRFASQIQLFNRSGKSLDVQLDLTISGPIAIEESLYEAHGPDTSGNFSRKITLPPTESGFFVPLLLRAKEDAGVAHIELTSTFAESEAIQRMELAVRPPYPRITRTDSYAIPPGASREITLPAEWFPGTRRAVLSISGIPELQLADAAKFLLEYPYYCLEQTVSSAWALLALPDLVTKLDPNLATREQLQTALSERMMRIQSMQSYNGAFSPWQGIEPTSAWNSAYATHFLVAGKAAGVSIPQQTLDSALSYLRQLVAFSPNADNDNIYAAELALRAYICYILSVNNEPPHAWMSYLRDNISYMPNYGRILLASAYAHAGERPLARELLGEQAPSLSGTKSPTGERYNLDSALRSQALYLLAWNEIDPGDPATVSAAATLLRSLRETGRYTTQELGFALPALANFYAHRPDEGQADMRITLPGDLELAAASGDENRSMSLSEDLTSLRVTNTGTGTGYLSWTADGIPSEKPAAENLGLQASVEYHDTNGLPIDLTQPVKRGTRIIGSVKLRPLAGAAEDIVVVLPFAAGLEIENPRLMDPAEETPYGSEDGRARTEMRDDRLLLFVDRIGRTFTWKFAMRAVSAGTFTLPPVAAEGMYDPGTRSVSETGSITIVDK